MRTNAEMVVAVVFGVTLVACGSASDAVSETEAVDVTAPSGRKPDAQAPEPQPDASGTGSAAVEGWGRWGRGGWSSDSPGIGAAVVSTDSPTAAEIEGLIWMREEEKLARDVYLTLFDLWGTPIFERIAASERRHAEAVGGLIDAYGLDDPVTDDAVGTFANPELQTLHDDLVEDGSASLVDALAVGALIEDLDITDLRRRLSETDEAAIERVYGNLAAGSENHLRAFVRQLEANGAEYQPVHLDRTDFDEILAASGSGSRRGGRGRGSRTRTV